jgi:hypothetical protein
MSSNVSNPMQMDKHQAEDDELNEGWSFFGASFSSKSSYTIIVGG